LYISVTETVIRCKSSSKRQLSSANHCCYCVQECHTVFFLPEQDLLRLRVKMSVLQNPQQTPVSPCNPYTGGTTSNCTHTTLCLLAPNTRHLISLA
jgi:hypothetical protein